MKKFLCLVFCSLFIFTGCQKASYFEIIEPEEVSDDLDTAQDSQIDAGATIYVHVAGAVQKPGVYQLPNDSRVFQAIDVAGGLLDTADDANLNMASEITDGQKIYVYTKAELEQIKMEQDSSSSDGLVNINSATADELCSLPGIGPSKANLIVSHRDENGKFNTIEDIKSVSGIGDGTYSRIQSLIKVE